MFRFFKRNAAILLAVAAGATGAISTAYQATNWEFWVLVGISILAIVGQAVVGQRVIATSRAIQEEFKLAVYDQVGPLSRQLSSMAKENLGKRKAMLDGTIQLAVGCASGLAGDSTRARATFFKTKMVNSHQAFVPAQSAGRGDAAQSVFKKGAGSEEGDAVWESAEKDLERFVVDVDKNPPPGWDASRKRAYRTFITVPVRSGDSLVGLLTVNAVRPGDLSENDVKTMRVMASLIGTAIGMSRTN